ncbi:MAG: hypothetical protein GXY74_00835 [Phycisphaerae bacterium]|nr:hypothetical protein [Phycisphaerae bacterium]
MTRPRAHLMMMLLALAVALAGSAVLRVYPQTVHHISFDTDLPPDGTRTPPMETISPGWCSLVDIAREGWLFEPTIVDGCMIYVRRPADAARYLAVVPILAVLAWLAIWGLRWVWLKRLFLPMGWRRWQWIAGGVVAASLLGHVTYFLNWPLHDEFNFTLAGQAVSGAGEILGHLTLPVTFVNHVIVCAVTSLRHLAAEWTSPQLLASCYVSPIFGSYSYSGLRWEISQVAVMAGFWMVAINAVGVVFARVRQG